MSIAEKLTQIAENEQKVYDAGKQAQYDAFWDAYQIFGSRKNYNFAFAGEGGWDSTTFCPKYDIVPTACNYMFAYGSCYNMDLADRFEECGIVFDTSKSTTFSYFCQYNAPKRLPVISTIGCSDLKNMFSSSLQTTIDALILRDDGSQKVANMFNGNRNLETIIFEGTIGQNGLNLQWSTKLTHDSLMSIINALKDYSEDTSGTVWEVVIGETNLAKLTDEEKQIAQGKGWILS